MAFKLIYFLILLITVLDYVQAATQLRLVNGLLIIEDRHTPLSVLSGHDLPEHGYLNRTSSRRLLKDAKASTVALRSRSVTKILQSTPTVPTTTTREKPVDEVSLSIENSVTDNLPLATRTPDVLTTTSAVTEKKTERDIPATETQLKKDNKDLDNNNKKKNLDGANKADSVSTSFTHTTAVNSVTSPTMDVITIIWYLSTFVALIAFFVVMVCSDKYCGRSAQKPEEATVTAPATPAPSYREFAPPSYDSVMRKYKNRVFIIPMLNESGELKVPGETTGESINPGASSIIMPSNEQPTVAAVPDSEDNSQRRSNDSSTTSQESEPAGEIIVEVVNEIYRSGVGNNHNNKQTQSVNSGNAE